MTIESLMRVLLMMFFHEVVIENRVAHVFNNDDERVGKITFNSYPPFIVSVSGMYWVTEKVNNIKTRFKFCMGPDFNKYLSANTIDCSRINNVPLEE